VRGEEVIIAHHDTVIESEDHVILFLQTSVASDGREAVPGRGHVLLAAIVPDVLRSPFRNACLGLGLADGLQRHHAAARVVAVIYGDGAGMPFLARSPDPSAPACVIWLPVRRVRAELRLRDGFLVVVLFWVLSRLDRCAAVHALAETRLVGDRLRCSSPCPG
jgi:hypothetical protein